ncbi:MAG: HEAT repeat domain-containing protein, partial [Myxococcota bacterium]
GQQIAEPPVTPKLDVEEHAPSGRTLDGTGESFADLKDEDGDGEMSAPQLGGHSEPDNPRQTQHISKEDSGALGVEASDVSAPRLDGDPHDSRRTQAIPPGTEASSSVVEESEPQLEQPEGVASTSFGIPFTDDQDEQQDDEVDEAEEEDPSSTTFGIGFVDDDDVDDDDDEAPAAERDDDAGEAELNERPRKDPSLPVFDVENSNSTMMGGFEVADSQSSYAEQVKRRERRAETDDSDDFDRDDFSDEDGPSLESLGSGASFGTEESSATKDVPEAQIVRFTSLANGRQTLQDSPPEDPSDPEEIPTVEPSSEDLDNGSIAFTHEDLEETADLLDSRNPANAFNAAEQIVEWGGKAVQVLRKRFPGRLFVDRYEYTHDTLPPAEEHGPVIAALAHLNDDAVSVVEDHLEDSSVELRFYATLLFKELPVDNVTDKLIERLFDRDAMIRDIAADILINRTDEAFKDERLLPRLRDEVETARDDIHVEISARLLGRMRDRYAVPTLIEALEDASGRIQQTIQGALSTITYKKLSPSVSEWRNWWASAHAKSRQDWIVEALNNDSEDVRRLVHHELKSWDDLDLDYHPDQPKKLRMRAQEQLREWFDARD